MFRGAIEHNGSYIKAPIYWSIPALGDSRAEELPGI